KAVVIEGGWLARNADASAHQAEAAIVGHAGGEFPAPTAVRTTSVGSTIARPADGERGVFVIEAPAAATAQGSEHIEHIAELVPLVAHGLDVDRRTNASGGVGRQRGNGRPAFVEAIEGQRAAERDKASDQVAASIELPRLLVARL